MSIKKSKSSVWFTLGSENETMFSGTWNFFQLDCRRGQGVENTKWPEVLYLQYISLDFS